MWPDRELVHDPGGASLHVEEMSAHRHRGVDGAAIGCGLAKQREMSAANRLEVTERGTGGVRGIEISPRTDDPAGRFLARGNGINLG